MPTASHDHPTIAVLDDDEATRDSIGMLLTAVGYKHTGFATADAFFAGSRCTTFDCLVLDLYLGETSSGLDVLKRVRATGPTCPVIMITAHGDVSRAVQAMHFGAADFLQKPYQGEELIASINRARIQGAHARHAAERLARLAPRERTVLAFLVDGLSNRDVATRLDISVRTVEVHRANLMTKLGVASFAEAIRLALTASPGA